jgi:hypothetical protein
MIRATVTRRSSVKSRAVVWKRYICSAIEEISFEPAVISFLVVAFLTSPSQYTATQLCYTYTSRTYR